MNDKQKLDISIFWYFMVGAILGSLIGTGISVSRIEKLLEEQLKQNVEIIKIQEQFHKQELNQ